MTDIEKKEIEEIAKLLSGLKCRRSKHCCECEYDDFYYASLMARTLYDAGYRKNDKIVSTLNIKPDKKAEKIS